MGAHRGLFPRALQQAASDGVAERDVGVVAGRQPVGGSARMSASA